MQIKEVKSTLYRTYTKRVRQFSIKMKYLGFKSVQSRPSRPKKPQSLKS